SNRIGEVFDGIVTGVTPHGTFVRVLKPAVEGLLAQGQQGADVGDRLHVKLIRTDVLRFRIVFPHASNSSMRCIRSVGEVNGVPFSGGGRPEEYTHARLGNHRFPVIVWQSLYGLDLSCSDPHPARPSHFGSSGRLAPFGYRALPAPAGLVRTGFGSWAFPTWSGCSRNRASSCFFLLARI